MILHAYVLYSYTTIWLTKTQCQRCNSMALSQLREPLMPPSNLDFQFQNMVTELFDLHGKNYIMYVDQYTGCIEFAPLPLGKAVAICNVLRSWFSTYCTLEEISSDRGALFDSLESNLFLEDGGITKCISSAHYAQSNSQAKLAVKTAKKNADWLQQWLWPPMPSGSMSHDDA